LEKQIKVLGYGYRNINKKLHNVMRERTIEAPVNPQQQSKTSRQSQTTLSLNHVIDWDRAKMNDRESNRMDRWIRKAIHIRKKQDKSMN